MTGVRARVALPDALLRGSVPGAGGTLAVLEPRSGEWNLNREWGGSYESAVGAGGLGGAGAVVGILELPKTYGPPSVIQAALTLLSLDAVVAHDLIRCVVTTGAGAGQNRFELDWRNGTTFSVPSNLLRIEARQDGTYAPRVRLSAILGRNTANHRGLPPTWSTLVEILVAPANVIVPVPTFARSLRVRALAGANANLLVQFLNGSPGGVLVEQFVLPGDQAVRHEGVSVPASATHVNCATVGANNVTFRLEFDLDV